MAAAQHQVAYSGPGSQPIGAYNSTQQSGFGSMGGAGGFTYGTAQAFGSQPKKQTTFGGASFGSGGFSSNQAAADDPYANVALDLNSIKPASKPTAADPAQKPVTDEPKKETLSAAEAIKNADELY